MCLNVNLILILINFNITFFWIKKIVIQIHFKIIFLKGIICYYYFIHSQHTDIRFMVGESKAINICSLRVLNIIKKSMPNISARPTTSYIHRG